MQERAIYMASKDLLQHPPEGEGAIPFYDTLQGEKARIREYKIE
jgi:hypothetical protein